MEKELYKNRSFSACIAAAFNLFTANFKNIMHRMWLPMLLYTLSWAAQVTILLNILPGALHPQTFATNPLNALSSAFSIITLVFMIWFYVRLFGLLNHQTSDKNLTRFLKFIIGLVAISFVLGFILGIIMIICTTFAAMNHLPQETILGRIYLGIFFTVIVIVLLILPVYYFGMKYMIDDNTRIRKHFFSVIGCGYRHYGFIFATLMLSYLITLPVLLICSTPLIILGVSNGLSVLGQMRGDAPTLPTYFPIITYLAAVITGAATIIGNLWGTFVGYYMYGSIEAREAVRSKQKEIAETTEE